MAINGDYATPVTVNGFSCKNCTDVSYAKKHVDPAHPKDGPYGVNSVEAAKKADAVKDLSPVGHRTSPAVLFGGGLAGLATGPATQTRPETGSRIDLYA